MSLGGYPALSLREARTERDKAQALLARGIDPQVERDQKRTRPSWRANTPSRPSSMLGSSIAARNSRKAVRARCRRSCASSTRTCCPPWGRCRSTTFAAPALGVLAAIEKRKAFTTAEKVRTWFNQLFRYALVIAEGLEVNPAADLDVVAEPKPPVAHNPYLHLPELPEFLQKLRLYNPRGWQTQLGVRLLFLTGVRTGSCGWPNLSSSTSTAACGSSRRRSSSSSRTNAQGRQGRRTCPYIVPLSLQAIEIVRYLLG
jgi:hypothetical protein